MLNQTDIPDPFAREVEPAAVRSHPPILCLDLGTHTGWASMDADGRGWSGSFNAAIIGGRHHPGQKWANWRAEVSRLIERFGPVVIVFEDVKGHGKGGVFAAHAYGGFRAFLEWMASTRNIPVVPVGVKSVKKHFTGNGNANKAKMLAEARVRGFRPDDDNEADAIAIRSWALANLKSIIK